jgi:DNA (cytosine-5)-methyltransferase 1
MGESKTLEWWDDWTDKMKENHLNGNGHGKSLAIEVQRLSCPPHSAATENTEAQTSETVQDALNS